MANKVWTGAVDDSVIVAGNYSPSGIPANGDVIFCNDQAQQDMATGLQDSTWQAKTISLIVEKSFIKKIGASGNAFTPGGFDSLVFSGSGGQCFFNTDDGATGPPGSDTIARLVVDSQANLNDIVNITGNNVARIIARRGKVALSSGVTVTDRISVTGGELTIPSGCTLTGVETKIKDGKMTSSSATPVVVIDGGIFTLAGVVGIGTYLEMSGGEFNWDADTTSTIALSEVFGGVFQTRNERSGRTLTEINMYDDGTVDFKKGGLLLTLTAGVRCFGNKRPVFPSGSKYTIAV